MPQLIDVGRIGRDGELRFTPKGDAVISVALAMDYGRKGEDGKRPVQWGEFSLWNKQAEALAPYLLKGQQVLVTVDDVHIEEYQSQGATRSKLVGRISNLKLVGSAPQQQQGQQPQGQQQQRPQQQGNQQRPQQGQRPQNNQQQASPQQNYDDFEDTDIPF